VSKRRDFGRAVCIFRTKSAIFAQFAGRKLVLTRVILALRSGCCDRFQRPAAQWCDPINGYFSVRAAAL